MAKESNGWLGTILSSLVGFASPELMKTAKKVVVDVPKDSWLRSESAARFTGIIRELVEKASGGWGDAGKALGAALSDFLEYAGTELYTSSPEKAKATADDWMKRFVQSAEKRMQDARTLEYLEKLIPKLEAEFQARKRIIEMVEQVAEQADAKARAEADKNKPKPIDWDVVWTKAKKFAEDALSEAKRLAMQADGWLAPAAAETAKFSGVSTKGKLW